MRCYLRGIVFHPSQTLAATQTPGTGSQWFQGTADAVRQFSWLFEVGLRVPCSAAFCMVQDT